MISVILGIYRKNYYLNRRQSRNQLCFVKNKIYSKKVINYLNNDNFYTKINLDKYLVFKSSGTSSSSAHLRNMTCTTDFFRNNTVFGKTRYSFLNNQISKYSKEYVRNDLQSMSALIADKTKGFVIP